MVAFLEILVTFAALLALCLFLSAKTGLASGATPLFVLCASMVWYSALGCLHLLPAAGVLWFAAAAAAAVWLWLHRKKLSLRDILSPSMVYFVLASLAVCVVFAARRPVFSQWDEFSFWGIAAKVVKTENQLYTFHPGEMRATTFVPGLIMLDYAFQFLGSTFVPWKVYAAYDILYFAVFAAAFSMLRRKQWYLAVPAATVLTLTPFLMTVYYRDIYVRTVYINAYADIPMGLLFGASLAAYFAPRKKTPAVVLGALLAVTATCIVKDMGFALCLIAAAIICFDLLFVQKEDVPFFRLKGLWGKLCWCASLVAAPVAAFLGWAAHMGAVLQMNRFEIGGAENMGMAQMVLTGLRELVGIGRTEKFSEIMSSMWQALYATSLTMFKVGGDQTRVGKLLNGSGAIAIAVILTILLAAFLLGDKRMKTRTAWAALWSALGFAAFYIFTGFTYVYVFKGNFGYELGDYNRYIFPYYIGWFILAVCMLCASLKDTSPGGVGALFLLAVCGGCLWRADEFLQPQLTVLDYPEEFYRGDRAREQTAAEAKQLLTEDDRLFIVSLAPFGLEWFQYYYEFYPDVAVDYSFGCGADFTPETLRSEAALPSFFTEEQRAYYTTHPFTGEVWCRYLRDSGCTAIFMEQWDDAFVEHYGDWFTDGLQSGARIYRITGEGEQMRFVPAGEGAAS